MIAWKSIAFIVMMSLLMACNSIVTPTATPPRPPAPTKPPQVTPAPTPAAKPTATPEPTTEPAIEPTAAPEATATATPLPISAAGVDALDLSGKNVEVVFLHRYSGLQVTRLLEIANDFNAVNPYGIQVRLERAGSSYTDVYNMLNAAIQAGSGLPALSMAYQDQVAVYRGEGLVADLRPFMQSKKYGLSADDLQDFFPYFLTSDSNPRFAGEVLGWPVQRSMQVLYANLDWLQQLGAPEPPRTLNEFEDLACRASDKAQEKYGWIWKDDASDFAALVFANGGEILNASGSAYVFNSPQAVEALAMLQRMFKNGCAVELPRDESFGEQDRFAAGKLLFVTGSSSGLPFYASLVRKSANPFPWTIAMHPQANPGDPRVDLNGASWVVLKTTPEQELAAWLFIKHFTEQENTATWAIISNALAMRRSAAPDAAEKVQANRSYARFPEAVAAYARLYEWIQYGKVESPAAGYSLVRKIIEGVVEKVAVKGAGDPQAALDAAVEKANQVLEEFAPNQ